MRLFGLISTVIGAFFAVTLHEYIKARVSYTLGDPVPKAHGRLTLNPMKHFEPVGFLLMCLTGYGWGKPTDTAAIYYKDRKKGIVLTYVTPSVVNLLAGTVFSLVAHLCAVQLLTPAVIGSGASAGLSAVALAAVIQLFDAVAKANVSLAFFNAIPVYPLDGAKLLALALSPEKQVQVAVYEKVFQIILIFVVLTGGVAMVLSPLQNVFLLR